MREYEEGNIQHTMEIGTFGRDTWYCHIWRRELRRYPCSCCDGGSMTFQAWYAVTFEPYSNGAPVMATFPVPLELAIEQNKLGRKRLRRWGNPEGLRRYLALEEQAYVRAREWISKQPVEDRVCETFPHENL